MNLIKMKQLAKRFGMNLPAYKEWVVRFKSDNLLDGKTCPACGEELSNVFRFPVAIEIVNPDTSCGGHMTGRYNKLLIGHTCSNCHSWFDTNMVLDENFDSKIRYILNGNMILCTKCGSGNIVKQHTIDGVTISHDIMKSITKVNHDHSKIKYLNYICLDCGTEYDKLP
jgi:DNA-directed RNA polymerase subunit RPC12/RpoP